MRHGGRWRRDGRPARGHGRGFPLAGPWFFGRAFRGARLRKVPGPRAALPHAAPAVVHRKSLLFYTGFMPLSLSRSGHNGGPKRYSRVCTTLMIFKASCRLSAGFPRMARWRFISENTNHFYMVDDYGECPNHCRRPPWVIGGGKPGAYRMPWQAWPGPVTAGCIVRFPSKKMKTYYLQFYGVNPSMRGISYERCFP